MQANQAVRGDSEKDAGKVISPFSGATELKAGSNRSGGTKVGLWIGLAILLVAGGVVGGLFVSRYLNDPYRTLEPFPVAKYLEGHRTLSGLRFKGNLRVEADLGWKEGVGRLMLFSTNEDARPIAVMVPAPVAKEIYFTKGQGYLAELEVKEGGLIYANSCKKN